MLNKIVSMKHFPNILGDGISYMDHLDFSEANLNDENRLNVITGVASVCYQSSKSFGSESLYDRLMAEAGGLPSSSFEFVPMLLEKAEYDLTWENINGLKNGNGFILNIEKYGEWVEDGQYLLTNFRAAVYDKEQYGDLCDFTKRYNTKEECKIIKNHFNVFCVKTDLPTFGQMVRHRVNWQVLSRRYVSGERVQFDFYIAEKMKDVWSNQIATQEYGAKIEHTTSTQDVIDICVKHYRAALAKGIKPQVARGIIPQCAYTIAWCAFQPRQLANFFKMRCDSHAQWEIQQFAYKMEESVKSGFMEIKLSPEREAELVSRLKDYAENGVGSTLTKEEMLALLDSSNEDTIKIMSEAGAKALTETLSENVLTSDQIDGLLDIAEQGENLNELTDEELSDLITTTLVD